MSYTRIGIWINDQAAVSIRNQDGMDIFEPCRNDKFLKLCKIAQGQHLKDRR